MFKGNYRWECPCGKQGRVMSWEKMVKNLNRHQIEHERKLEWDFEVDFVSMERMTA